MAITMSSINMDFNIQTYKARVNNDQTKWTIDWAKITYNT